MGRWLKVFSPLFSPLPLMNNSAIAFASSLSYLESNVALNAMPS